jgi:transcriptional regulator with XRE-family HTH domain
MMKHDEMVKKMMSNPDVKAEYHALAGEFSLFDELLKARLRARMTQADIAKRMGTKTPAIARLEAGGGSKKHSPSLATLRKYAKAVGCKLEIKLIPEQSEA